MKRAVDFHISIPERDFLCEYLLTLVNDGFVSSGVPPIQTPPVLHRDSVFRSLVVKVEEMYRHQDPSLRVASMHCYIDFVDTKVNSKWENPNTWWHRHPVRTSAIMYLLNPEGLRTEFSDGSKDVSPIERVWQLFDGTKIHRPEPPKTSQPKITLACDLDAEDNMRFWNNGCYRGART